MSRITKLLMLFLLVIVALAEARAEEVAFIVNAENPVSSISETELSNLFLKRKREWPDGTSVRFIDRKDGSSVRKKFLLDYLEKTGREVELYWIGQKQYSGDSAPVQVESDSSVASFVGSFEGGIGYVSASFPLPRGVKKIEVTP